MGLDAVIVAKKAKRYFYFDRCFNFMELVWQTKGAAAVYFSDEGASAAQVKAQTQENVRYWLACKLGNEHRVLWNQDIAAFVDAFPEDTFNIVHDQMDEYFEIVVDGTAQEWHPEKREPISVSLSSSG